MSARFGDLAHEPRWVGWRSELRAGKATKVPIDPRTGRNADSTDPGTWSTRAEAEDWAALNGGQGQGVVLGPLPNESLLAGVDADSCRDPATGEIAPWAQEIAARLDSYCEVSPSGTGVKIIFVILPADRPAIDRLMGGKQGRKFANGGGEHRPAIEIYLGGRYFTVTDDMLSGDDELRAASLADLEWLVGVAGPKLAGKGDESKSRDNSRSARAFRLGAALKGAGSSYQEMRDALLSDKDPDVAEWAQTKGLANGEREMRRIFDNAGVRQTIELVPGETERAVDKLESLLITSARGLYQRGGLIVSTSFAKMQTFDGKTIIGQVIEERGDYALLEDAEAVAKFVRFDEKGKTKPAPAPMALIRTLKERKHRLKLPVLVAVVNCPSISADGRLLDEPGFAPETGVLYDPLGAVFPPAPLRPTKADAQTALARILRLLETFDFVSGDDKAVALSLILTAVARRGLDHAPLHGFDAPVAGSGKSLLVDIASILATGHEASVLAQGESREEAEKKLSAVLMRGDPIIPIDNCEAPLEGVVLNQALTQTALDLRILGFSKTLKTQARALITATGNNLIVKGDATRRSLIGRLDPKCERPELREFDYDPIADAKEHRAELVVAVLAVLRAYHAAGRPNRPKPPLQSFVPWSDTVRGAIMWLGQGDPVATMTRLRETDPELESLKTVITVWRDAFGYKPTTLSAAVEAANATIATPEPGSLDQVRVPANPALREALLIVAGRGPAIDVRVLGRWFAKHQDRIVNLEDETLAFEKAGLLHGLLQWRVWQPRGRLGG
jgi:hypothetical protein